MKKPPSFGTAAFLLAVRTRKGGGPRPAALPPPEDRALDYATAREAALARRPQLLALQRLVDKANASMDLARKDANPDLDLRWRTVRVALTTHDAGGLTARDFALAEAVEGIA